MTRQDFNYYGEVLAGIWYSFTNSPAVVAVVTVVGAFVAELWLNAYSVVIGVCALAIIDTHVAIKASIKNGGKYESYKIKQGLLNKIKIYLTIFILAIIFDILTRKIYDYQSFYVVFLSAFIIGLYEIGSILENMVLLFPNSEVVKLLSKYLNLTKKKVDNEIKNKLK